MAVDAIHAGHIVEVLERYRPTPMPINIVYPASRMLPPRVRVLIDALGTRSEGENDRFMRSPE